MKREKGRHEGETKRSKHEERKGTNRMGKRMRVRIGSYIEGKKKSEEGERKI